MPQNYRIHKTVTIQIRPELCNQTVRRDRTPQWKPVITLKSPWQIKRSLGAEPSVHYCIFVTL